MGETEESEFHNLKYEVTVRISDNNRMQWMQNNTLDNVTDEKKKKKDKWEIFSIIITACLSIISIFVSLDANGISREALQFTRMEWELATESGLVFDENGYIGLKNDKIVSASLIPNVVLFITYKTHLLGEITIVDYYEDGSYILSKEKRFKIGESEGIDNKRFEFEKSFERFLEENGIGTKDDLNIIYRIDKLFILVVDGKFETYQMVPSKELIYVGEEKEKTSYENLGNISLKDESSWNDIYNELLTIIQFYEEAE